MDNSQPAMDAAHRLVQDNIALLQQAEQLVQQLSDAVYTHNDLPPFGSGVGQHIRHVIDFYTAFLLRDDGRVDYDRRQRNPELASDRTSVLRRMQQLRIQLAEGIYTDEELWTTENSSGPSGHAPIYCRSSDIRELLFLFSHTVHHYAMIAMLLQAQGIEPPRQFGVAPSTLNYWRQYEHDHPSTHRH